MGVYYITLVSVLALGTVATAARVTAGAGGKYLSIGAVGASAAIMIAVSGFRWRVGTDYEQYAANYWKYSRADILSLRYIDEPGIYLVAQVGRIYSDAPTSMFMIAAVITVGVSVAAIYRSSANLLASLLLYVLTTTWQGSFNGVRQYLACAFLLWGHKYIVERNIFKYTIVIVIGSFFHVSLLLFLALYALPARPLKPAAALLLIFLAGAGAYSYSLVELAVMEVRGRDIGATEYFNESINPWRLALAAAPMFLYVIFTDKGQMKPASHFYLNLMLVHALLTAIAINSAYIARFALYTGAFVALALPSLINTKEPKVNALLYATTIALYCVYWYLETTTNGDIVPYTSVLGGVTGGG